MNGLCIFSDWLYPARDLTLTGLGLWKGVQWDSPRQGLGLPAAHMWQVTQSCCGYCKIPKNIMILSWFQAFVSGSIALDASSIYFIHFHRLLYLQILPAWMTCLISEKWQMSSHAVRLLVIWSSHTCPCQQILFLLWKTWQFWSSNE